MPAPCFTAEQWRGIRTRYLLYREYNGSLTKTAWGQREAKRQGCDWSTIRRILVGTPAKNGQRHWLFQEIQQLRQYVGQGLTDAAIGKHLNRTGDSVQTKRRQLGLRVFQYAKDNQAKIISLIRLGFFDREIAEQLGFCRGTILRLRHQLRMKPGRYQHGDNINATGKSYEKRFGGS